MDCYNHGDNRCPSSKPFTVTCMDCGNLYCSNLPNGFQCRSCYLMDEHMAGLL